MTENFRQEIAIPFGGQTYRVRPEFGRIMAIEAATNQSAYELGIKILNARASVLELATVMSTLTAPEAAGQPALSIAACGEIIMDDGFVDLLQPVGTFLVRAMRGNKEHAKEAAAKAEAGADAAPGPQSEQDAA